jgi:hypothetical protein
MWYCHRVQLDTWHMRKSEPTTTVSIRFLDTVLHAVKNISEAQDRSVSYLTVKAVRAWLAPVPTPQPVTAAQPPPPVAAVQPVPAPMPAQSSDQSIAKTAGEAKAMRLPRFLTVGRAREAMSPSAMPTATARRAHARTMPHGWPRPQPPYDSVRSRGTIPHLTAKRR